MSKAQDRSWHLCLGAAPCQDTAHQSQTLNMSPDLLFFSKKKKKGPVCSLLPQAPHVFCAGSSSTRRQHQLRVVYSLHQTLI